MDPAGIYVHVPFCARICPYCDFAVTTGGPDRRRRYLECLLREVAGAPDLPVAADTIYLGGGTPSSLTPDQLGELLAAVRDRWELTADPWLTLEANPEDVTPEAAASWRRMGFRTVSLGVQSFDSAALDFLGRRHTPDQAEAAVGAAREAGLRIVSIDLIFGLPGQTEATWEAELEAAARLGPDHVSCYQLTIHAGTPFGRAARAGRLREMDQDEQARLYRIAHERLGQAGLEAYEVSNFAVGPESRSRHNAKYWRHAPYLGVGPSAHSFDGKRTRWWNRRDLREWSEAIEAGASPVREREHLREEQLALEAVMFGLRTRRGVDLDEVVARTGIELETPANVALVRDWEQRGLLQRSEPRRWAPTTAGMAVAEALARAIEVPTPQHLAG